MLVLLQATSWRGVFFSSSFKRSVQGHFLQRRLSHFLNFLQHFDLQFWRLQSLLSSSSSRLLRILSCLAGFFGFFFPMAAYLLIKNKQEI